MQTLKSKTLFRPWPTFWVAIFIICSGLPASAAEGRGSGLKVVGRVATVSTPAMVVAAPAGFKATDPHSFSKTEDNGYHFDVSLVSFVRPRQVVSVVAERLAEDVPLSYHDLAAAQWPNPSFLSRASGCVAMTSSAAASMPAESGMAAILRAGFNPNGSFAYETVLLLAPDLRHEASIELITQVPTCEDAGTIQAALKALKSRIEVKLRNSKGPK